jgi:hypothetical protein
MSGLHAGEVQKRVRGLFVGQGNRDECLVNVHHNMMNAIDSARTREGDYYHRGKFAARMGQECHKNIIT